MQRKAAASSLAAFLALAWTSAAWSAQTKKLSEILQAPLPQAQSVETPAVPELGLPSKTQIKAVDVYDDPLMAVDDVQLTSGPQAASVGQSTVDAGSSRAGRILRAAASSSRASYSSAQIFNNVYSSLYSTLISWPNPGYEFRGCKEGTLAFVLSGTNMIYLCSRSVYGSYSGSHSLAQILIHESAHLTGYWNECDATVVEVAAMRFSGEGLAFQNGYMRQCGLE
ncbi:MAG: hypothetical protein HY921_11845 [Elusimicrobia bacterium]|nr:hypothetical protein [Elusimicrobiota bacterium]